MKQSHLPKFILCALFLFCTATALPYNGKTALLNNLNYDKELTCTHASRYVVTYHHSASTSGIRHYFSVQDMTTGSSVLFPLDAFYTPNTPLREITLTINDLKIDDNGQCWFCGQKSIATNSGVFVPGMGWQDITIDYGVVGFFSVTDVLDGSGSYQMFTLQQTSSITRIEPRSYYEQTFMIGYLHNGPVDTQGNPMGSCLVGLNYDHESTQWQYSIATPDNSLEQFSDIAHCGMGIVVASRYLGDWRHVGLRYFKNGPIADNPDFGHFSLCNKYDISTATNAHASSGLRRKDSDPLMLASSQGGANLTLAFACDSTAYGIAAYKIQVVDLGDVRIGNGMLLAASTYSALIDCKVPSASSPTDFLVDDIANSRRSLQSVDWVSDPGSIPLRTGASCLYSNYSWQSITHFDSASYRFRLAAGHRSDGKPSYSCYKSLPSPTSLSPCISSDRYYIYALSTPSYASGESVSVYEDVNALKTFDIGNLDIINHTFTCTTLTPSTICSY